MFFIQVSLLLMNHCLPQKYVHPVGIIIITARRPEFPKLSYFNSNNKWTMKNNM